MMRCLANIVEEDLKCDHCTTTEVEVCHPEVEANNYWYFLYLTSKPNHSDDTIVCSMNCLVRYVGVS